MINTNAITEIETSAGRIYTVQADWSSEAFAGLKKRAAEKLAVAQLLQAALADPEAALSYYDSGQPYLANRPELHVSVSHSNGWLALYLGRVPVGIDIQTFTTQLERGHSYFINAAEFERFGNSWTNRQLYLIWGAKEAFYKQLSGQIPDLKNEVTITATSEAPSGEIQLRYREETHHLPYSADDEKVLVYTI